MLRCSSLRLSKWVAKEFAPKGRCFRELNCPPQRSISGFGLNDFCGRTQGLRTAWLCPALRNRGWVASRKSGSSHRTRVGEFPWREPVWVGLVVPRHFRLSRRAGKFDLSYFQGVARRFKHFRTVSSTLVTRIAVTGALFGLRPLPVVSAVGTDTTGR